MENWSYRRNGAVEGPVSKDQLKSLYDAGEITLQTLVRSSSAGGGWRRYGDVPDLRPVVAQPRIPRAVKSLWPWFVFGTPLIGGVLDVLLMRSIGNGFVESNASWLSFAPIGVNILAIVAWLFLIWIELRKKAQNKVAAMVVWIVAAPVYQAFSWWAMALVSGFINVSLGFELPECQSDIAKAQVKELFEKSASKAKDAGAGAVALTDISQQWGTDRIRMCTGKLTANAQTYSVRYKLQDRGNNLFRNTLHGLSITMLVE